MMVHVQKCQLAGLFAQHKEHAITKLDTFGEIEPPNGVCYLTKEDCNEIGFEKRREGKILFNSL